MEGILKLSMNTLHHAVRLWMEGGGEMVTDAKAVDKS